jgi:hypothetical protein
VPDDVLNVAVTVLFASIVTLHEPVPVQVPPQPAKVESAAAVAVRVTEPPLKFAEHELPQLIPAGMTQSRSPYHSW